MAYDDDDNDWNDWEPGDEDESSRDRESHKKLPVFIKGMELVEITRAIVDSIDEEKDVVCMRDQMMQNAYIIPAKIAGAEGGDLYSIRMDNAVLIKLAARELQAETSWCLAEDLCDSRYLHMLRAEIENFRLLFIEWVRSFDKTNDIEDDWNIRGLHE
jgi:hypothetical protein